MQQVRLQYLRLYWLREWHKYQDDLEESTKDADKKLLEQMVQYD